ncbi:hypothetical protein NDU88_003403 [Pleurodeles waltl]|uniref:Uncharacterized protein n=1 Tax=Pleurodeles waltl TaxID=8319 RepID=A0AAV7SEK8_PLEWA|nr:hypothetical protein NDU88_003403 [Pleurodeles waltl]
MQRQPIRYPVRQRRRDQEVITWDLDGLKCLQSRGERHAMEEWRAAALEEGTVTTDENQKEKRKRTAERTSRRPRRRNANQPATLQEKRGSLRCVPGANKGAQGWEDWRRREQEPRGIGKTGGEGNKNQGGVG